MISIKPHHFIDIIAQLGDDNPQFQPHPYGHAVHRIAHQILEHPDVMLCIVLGCDDICDPCVHNVSGACDDTIDTSFRPQAPASKQDYNQLIDARWCERLGLRAGDQLTARAFCVRLRDCRGNIVDIYRETPAARTLVRETRLQKGIRWFLRDQRTHTV